MDATRQAWTEHKPKVVHGYIVQISDEDLALLKWPRDPLEYNSTLLGFNCKFLWELRRALVTAGAL